VLAVTTAGALAASIAAGTPPKLPAAALGSAVLLHLLRVSAAVLAVALVGTVVARAWTGELPVKFGGAGVEYAVQTAVLKEDASDALRQLATAENGLRRALAAEAAARGELERRLARLEGRG
jgi:hypothetical protein